MHGKKFKWGRKVVRKIGEEFLERGDKKNRAIYYRTNQP
jgi:hypothetical protein